MNKLYLSVLSKIFTLFITGLLILNFSTVHAQCPVTAFASPLTIICGDTVKLNAIADGCKPLNNNFNGGTIGTDWMATTGAVVTNCTGTYTCVGSPAEGPYCLWMGAVVAAPRNVTTNDYNLTSCSAIGATICFDMKYATQAGPNPCEGIDLPAEGVSLQYSINGGGSWVTIQYWDPNGGYDANLINWKRRCIAVPGAALTTSTRFRWYQSQSSGAGFDTWGLDNIVIILTTPGYTFDWAHDALPPAGTPTTPPVTPPNNTTYTVTYTNGVSTCTASVLVTVAPITATITATPPQVCLNGQSLLGVVASSVPPPPAVCGNSVTGCQGVNTIIPMGAGTTAGTYFPLGRATSGTCLNGSGTIDNGFRMQMIIKSNELPAYFKYGQIYNLALNLVAVTAGTWDGFTISISCTNKTSFASNVDYVAGLTTVFGPKSVSLPASGWVTFDFDNHFDWTGSGNIVIQVCWLGTAAHKGDLNKTASGFNSTIYAPSCASTGCTSIQNPGISALRPSMSLGICYRVPPVLSYTWSPSSSLDNSSISNPIATLSASTNYTVTISDAARPMCNVTKSILINVVAPSATINPASPMVCPPGTPNTTITATGTPSVGGGSITSYQWTPTTNISNPNIANPSVSPTAATVYTVKITDNLGCTATQQVTVGFCGSVPIELISFNAVKKGNQAFLNWTTGSEVNSDYFLVEHSTNGNEYTVLQKVEASGNSTTIKTYAMLDNSPAGGTNYYRLRIVDKDAYWKNSNTAVLKFDLPNVQFNLSKLSPIPVENFMNYSIDNSREEIIELTILDLTGKVVKQEQGQVYPGNNSLAMDVSELAKGAYLLQAISKSGGMVVQRFIK